MKFHDGHDENQAGRKTEGRVARQSRAGAIGVSSRTNVPRAIDTAYSFEATPRSRVPPKGGTGPSPSCSSWNLMVKLIDLHVSTSPVNLPGI